MSRKQARGLIPRVPAFDGTPLRNARLSQWFTPMWLARRIAAWVPKTAPVQISMRQLNARVREVLGKNFVAREIHRPLGVEIFDKNGRYPYLRTRTGDRDSSRRLAMAWLAAAEYEVAR